jgi:hypothetical protein
MTAVTNAETDLVERSPAGLAAELHRNARVAFRRRAPRPRGLLRDDDELVGTSPTGRGPLSIALIHKPARPGSVARRPAGLFVLQAYQVSPDGEQCPIGNASATLTATALPHFAELVARALDRLIAESEPGQSAPVSGPPEPGDESADARSSEEGAP